MSEVTAFLRELWRGSYLLDNDHYNSICVKFVSQLKGDSAKAQEEYRTGFSSNLQRIKCFRKYFEWTRIPEKYLERFQKSREISNALREAGNTAYKALDITNAFRGYNLALSFAPNETEQLGLVYANRAALFLYIGMPQEALRDVEKALEFDGYGDQVRSKLEERKAKCQQRLIGKGQRETGDSNDDTFRNLFSSEGDERRFCDKNLLHLSSPPSGVLKGAADFVKVVYSPECGRRLVVTKDVPAGTPCVLEEPFVTSLERLLNWDTEHCAFCTKPFLGGIPCPSCTYAQFCDDHCVAKAIESGHQYEHLAFPYLHSTEAFHDTETMLIIRILMKVGSSYLYEMFCNNQETLAQHNTQADWSCVSSAKDIASSKILPGFDETSGTYDSSSYTSVFHLVSHKAPYDFKSLEESLPQVPKEFQCLMLTEVLDECLDYFKTTPSETKESFKDFVASLILQHKENLQYNILSLAEWYTPTLGPLSLSLWADKAKSSRKNPITKCYAVGVFPLVALCNHSCDPNAIFVKSCHLPRAAVVTSRRLKEGDELLISYKAPFTRLPWDERQSYLLENYKFLCQCYACVRKYSVGSTSPDPEDLVQCIASGCYEPPNKDSFHNLCPHCRHKVQRTSEVLEKLERAQEMIRKERFSTAYEILKEESDFLSANFTPNYEVFQVCQDLMRRSVVHLIHL